MIYKAPNPLDSQMLKAQLVQKMKYIHDTYRLSNICIDMKDSKYHYFAAIEIKYNIQLLIHDTSREQNNLTV